MKINSTRQSLLDALLVVSRAVSARAALQALSGILISTDGGVRLRATDMELGLEVGLEGEIDGAGSVVLPGRLLVEVARSLPDGSVSLSLREAQRDV
ncbi:MAG: DNA polymerase III subunit beta, partial [Solirubrobacterales bacterium]